MNLLLLVRLFSIYEERSIRIVTGARLPKPSTRPQHVRCTEYSEPWANMDIVTALHDRLCVAGQ